VRAGYYCIDTVTPINRNAFLAWWSRSVLGVNARHFLLGLWKGHGEAAARR
jgi:hypothetical protein